MQNSYTKVEDTDAELRSYPWLTLYEHLGSSVNEQRETVVKVCGRFT